MATIGTLNRRLDKVETKAAEMDGARAPAFDMYALLFVARLRTKAAQMALIAVLYEGQEQSAESLQILEQGKREARAAIRAAGETQITAALFEAKYFEYETRGEQSGPRFEWYTARRDKSMSLAKLAIYTKSSLQGLCRCGFDLWDKIGGF